MWCTTQVKNTSIELMFRNNENRDEDGLLSLSRRTAGGGRWRLVVADRVPWKSKISDPIHMENWN